MQNGFSLEELGKLPPSSWMDLYGAILYERYAHLATLMSVYHPRKPQETQKRFLRAANAALNQGEEPIWADPRRLKRMLMGAGVTYREKAKPEGEAQAESGVPAEGAEAEEISSEEVGGA